MDIPYNFQVESNWTWAKKHLQDKTKIINLYYRRDIIGSIRDKLRGLSDDEGPVIRKFENGPFGHLLEWKCGISNCQALNALLGRQISSPSIPDHELWFRINETNIRFSSQEFALVTGLSFGQSKFDPADPKHRASDSGVFKRFCGGKELSVNQLWELFSNGVIPEGGKKEDFLIGVTNDDYVKVANVLFLYLFCLSNCLRKKIDNFVWVLVDSISAWNKFPWGGYCLKYFLYYYNRMNTKRGRYHIYGASWALQIWAMEAIPEFGKQIGKIVAEKAFPRGLKWTFKNSKCMDFHSLLKSTDKCLFKLDASKVEENQRYYTRTEDLLWLEAGFLEPGVIVKFQKRRKPRPGEGNIKKGKGKCRVIPEDIEFSDGSEESLPTRKVNPKKRNGRKGNCNKRKGKCRFGLEDTEFEDSSDSFDEPVTKKKAKAMKGNSRMGEFSRRKGKSRVISDDIEYEDSSDGLDEPLNKCKAQGMKQNSSKKNTTRSKCKSVVISDDSEYEDSSDGSVETVNKWNAQDMKGNTRKGNCSRSKVKSRVIPDDSEEEHSSDSSDVPVNKRKAHSKNGNRRKGNLSRSKGKSRFIHDDTDYEEYSDFSDEPAKKRKRRRAHEKSESTSFSARTHICTYREDRVISKIVERLGPTMIEHMREHIVPGMIATMQALVVEHNRRQTHTQPPDNRPTPPAEGECDRHIHEQQLRDDSCAGFAGGRDQVNSQNRGPVQQPIPQKFSRDHVAPDEIPIQPPIIGDCPPGVDASIEADKLNPQSPQRSETVVNTNDGPAISEAEMHSRVEQQHPMKDYASVRTAMSLDNDNPNGPQHSKCTQPSGPMQPKTPVASASCTMEDINVQMDNIGGLCNDSCNASATVPNVVEHRRSAPSIPDPQNICRSHNRRSPRLASYMSVADVIETIHDKEDFAKVGCKRISKDNESTDINECSPKKRKRGSLRLANEQNHAKGDPAPVSETPSVSEQKDVKGDDAMVASCEEHTLKPVSVRIDAISTKTGRRKVEPTLLSSMMFDIVRMSRQYSKTSMSEFLEWYDNGRDSANPHARKELDMPWESNPRQRLTPSWFKAIFSPRKCLNSTHCDALINLVIYFRDVKFPEHAFLRDWTFLESHATVPLMKQNMSTMDQEHLKAHFNGIMPKQGPKPWRQISKVYGIANVGENHWVLYMADLKNQVIKVFDTLRVSHKRDKSIQDAFSHMTSNIAKLCQECDMYNGANYMTLLPRWKVKCMDGTPLQRNNHDCGVLVCKMLECLTTGKPVRSVESGCCTSYRAAYCYEIFTVSTSAKTS